MITIHRAELCTRSFDFEAFGGTAAEAREALCAGLVRHAKTYKIPPDWWREDEDNIEVTAITLGACYRGPEPI